MGKMNKESAELYMENMRVACTGKFLLPDWLYENNKEGHLKFARGVGVALRDFDEEAQNEILHGSYGSIYVIATLLKPILDAGEWINALKDGRDNL